MKKFTRITRKTPRAKAAIAQLYKHLGIEHLFLSEFFKEIRLDPDSAVPPNAAVYVTEDWEYLAFFYPETEQDVVTTIGTRGREYSVSYYNSNLIIRSVL